MSFHISDYCRSIDKNVLVGNCNKFKIYELHMADISAYIREITELELIYGR